MLVDTERCTGCHTCAFGCKSENNLPNNVWWNKTITGTPGKPDENRKMDEPEGKFVSKGGIVIDKDKNIMPLTLEYYTKACQHCSNPVCVEACPTGATYVRADGIVEVDSEKCIGCDSCIDACPYDVRHHNTEGQQYGGNFPVGGMGIKPHTPETVDKCNFCAHRVDRGGEPFCVTNCPAKARYFGDINNPKSEVAQILKKRKYVLLRPEAGTKPSVYFLV